MDIGFWFVGLSIQICLPSFALQSWHWWPGFFTARAMQGRHGIERAAPGGGSGFLFLLLAAWETWVLENESPSSPSSWDTISLLTSTDLGFLAGASVGVGLLDSLLLDSLLEGIRNLR